MGTGEVIRYLSRHGSDRVENALVISPLAPVLAKTLTIQTAFLPKFLKDSEKAIKNDRSAFMTNFFENFFNYNMTKGKLVSEDAFRANWVTGIGASPLGTMACIDTWATDFTKTFQVDVPLVIIHEPRQDSSLCCYGSAS